MKILISTPYYLPNVSGITVYINVLAEELVKRGHKVTILTSRHDLTTKKEETVNGVKIRRLKIAFKIGKGSIVPSFLFESIKEIKKHDVIDCQLPQPESLWIAIVGKFLGKKVFLTHHTDLSFWKGFKNKIIDGGVFICQYLAALLSTKIIPYTDDYAKNSYFLKRFFDKTVAIYPPIKFEEKEDFNLEVKINTLVKNKKYVIGFCGRIAKQKGIELLIKSSKLLDKKLGKDNYVILMVGPITVIGENYYDYLQNKYKSILKERFIFMDNIERKFLSTFYKKIDLLVLPSDDRLESFGWVQIEAMKCGTPCVATNLPGMRIPVLESKFGELFENKNEIDLANKIELVLKNGKKYYQNKFIKNIDIFNYEKSLDDYEKLFSERV
ncbi:MAG: glycosyltransferase family 4 protein [Candidatus Shapirobacteria bacterium]|nr:glycosyltransferase family 4 protein [Candidatus Shapirobacteria bacterium]MDD4410781.1 glycosyltransferase family 4 protein [Candidatus Shapirobacteria bacterium]